MKDSIHFYITLPFQDWLLGIEYIPEMTINYDDDTFYSCFSFGLLIFRIDFYKKIENNGS